MSIYTSSRKTASNLIKRFANANPLEFQEQIFVSDGAGGSSSSWVTKFICNAPFLAASSTSANETVMAMKLQSESTHKTYIQYADGTPSAKDRVLFRGKIYNITGVLNMAEADACWVVFMKTGVAT